MKKGVFAASLKTTIFTICLVLLSQTAVVAQNRIHLSLGFNQSYSKLDSLNYILNAFNAENTWTVKPLREIHAPAGITGQIGADFAGILLDIGYTMRNSSRKVKGDGSQGEGSQIVQLRYNASTVDIGLGVFFFRKPRLRIAAGAEMNLGNLTISGRRGTIGQVESQIYSRYVNELNFAATAFMQWMIAFQDGVGPGIFIRPYYQFGLRNNDYVPLNRVLRPTQWQSDPEFILGKQTNVGIKIGVFFGS